MARLRDDCFAPDGTGLMRMDVALALLEARLGPVTAAGPVGLDRACGRILAEDIVAGRDVPPHDNSAVDGYAFRHADVGNDGARLPLSGRAAAGHPLAGPAAPGAAVRIFTGAAMPAGTDTVCMQEDCDEAAGDDGPAVTLPPGLARGANRRRHGEDVRSGDTILAAGDRLRPQDVGLAASVGCAALPVRDPVRVAVFSTGDEVRDPGAALPDGCVYDANRHTLIGLLHGLGCAVTDLGILPDDAATVHQALSRAAGEADAIVTSGGVSTGEEDHIAAALRDLGTVHFWRLAIKPGRPLAMGQIGDCAFIGLPGNPAAMMVTFLRFARPAILRLGGATATGPRLYRVRAGFGLRKKPDRREWIRARLSSGADGVTVANRFPREGAGIMSSMVGSDGLVELPEDLVALAAGDEVDFLPFSEVTG